MYIDCITLELQSTAKKENVFYNHVAYTNVKYLHLTLVYSQLKHTRLQMTMEGQWLKVTETIKH
jgi:hypothetical protein